MSNLRADVILLTWTTPEAGVAATGDGSLGPLRVAQGVLREAAGWVFPSPSPGLAHSCSRLRRPRISMPRHWRMSTCSKQSVISATPRTSRDAVDRCCGRWTSATWVGGAGVGLRVAPRAASPHRHRRGPVHAGSGRGARAKDDGQLLHPDLAHQLPARLGPRSGRPRSLGEAESRSRPCSI